MTDLTPEEQSAYEASVNAIFQSPGRLAGDVADEIRETYGSDVVDSMLTKITDWSIRRHERAGEPDLQTSITYDPVEGWSTHAGGTTG